MAEEFVDMCAVCKQGVPRSDMVYQKGKVFHSQCFTDHGSSFPTPDSELAQLSARTRIDLVQLKNMKVRSELEKQSARMQKSKPVKKSKKSKKKSKVKRNTRLRKSKKVKRSIKRKASKSRARRPKKSRRRR